MRKNDLIGLSEDDARKLAKHNGMILRVVSKDGEVAFYTAEYRPNRYNVTIINDKVSQVTIG